MVFRYKKPTKLVKLHRRLNRQEQPVNEIIFPQITFLRRQKIITLYRDKTGSAKIIFKSYLSKNKNNQKKINKFCYTYQIYLGITFIEQIGCL